MTRYAISTGGFVSECASCGLEVGQEPGQCPYADRYECEDAASEARAEAKWDRWHDEH